MKMKAEDVIFGISALLSVVSHAWGDGCSDQQTSGAPVLNVCQQSNATLGLAYLSMITATMGSSTRCECTLRSKTPGLTTSTEFRLYSNDSHVSKCDQSLIQISPFQSVSLSDTPTFTCTSPRGSYSYTGNTTEDVKVTLTRRDTTVGVSYCLQVLPVRRAVNDMQLTCNIGTTVIQTTTHSSSSPSILTTPSSPRAPTTPLLSSPVTSIVMSSSHSATLSKASVTSMAASTREGAASGLSSTTTWESAPGQAFPVGAIAGIALGVTALVCITVIIVVVLFIRYRTKLLSSRQTGTDNSAYTHLSDVTRVIPRADPNYAIIQSESSGLRPGGSNATSGTSVYEIVDGVSSASAN